MTIIPHNRCRHELAEYSSDFAIKDLYKLDTFNGLIIIHLKYFNKAATNNLTAALFLTSMRYNFRLGFET